MQDFRDFNRNLKVQSNEASTSNWNDLSPTKEDLIAGDYKTGTINFHGLSIEIENPAGSIRSGDDWSIVMFNAYGYFVDVMGADGDELDVYVGEGQYTKSVTIIDQFINGEYDETKVMLGFPDEHNAMSNYFMNFDATWPRDGHNVFTVDFDTLILWLVSGKTKEPFANWRK